MTSFDHLISAIQNDEQISLCWPTAVSEVLASLI